MKTRTRVVATEPVVSPVKQRRPRAPKLPPMRFVDLDQSDVLVMHELHTDLDVKGSFVKVAPTVRTSERASLDSKGVRERLLAAGAAAVVFAPIVVPDSKSDSTTGPKPIAPNASPERHLRDWFESSSAPEHLVERALAESLTSVSEAGL